MKSVSSNQPGQTLPSQRNVVPFSKNGAERFVPPRHVDVVHRKVGDDYIFTSPDLPGLMVVDNRPSRAHEIIPIAVESLIAIYLDGEDGGKIECHYHAEFDAEEMLRKVLSGDVEAKFRVSRID